MTSSGLSITVIFASFLVFACKEIGMSLHKVDRCPDTNQSWILRKEKLICNDQKVYHCLYTEDFTLVEACIRKRQIEFGQCPLTVNGESISSHTADCPVQMLNCPRVRYPSNELYRFPGCFHTPTSPKLKNASHLMTMKTIESTTIQKESNTAMDNKQNTIFSFLDTKGNYILIGACLFIVIILSIVITVCVRLCIKRSTCCAKHRISNEDHVASSRMTLYDDIQGMHTYKKYNSASIPRLAIHPPITDYPYSYVYDHIPTHRGWDCTFVDGRPLPHAATLPVIHDNEQYDSSRTLLEHAHHFTSERSLHNERSRLCSERPRFVGGQFGSDRNIHGVSSISGRTLSRDKRNDARFLSERSLYTDRSHYTSPNNLNVPQHFHSHRHLNADLRYGSSQYLLHTSGPQFVGSRRPSLQNSYVSDHPVSDWHSQVNINQSVNSSRSYVNANQPINGLHSQFNINQPMNGSHLQVNGNQLVRTLDSRSNSNYPMSMSQSFLDLSCRYSDDSHSVLDVASSKYDSHLSDYAYEHNLQMSRGMAVANDRHNIQTPRNLVSAKHGTAQWVSYQNQHVIDNALGHPWQYANHFQESLDDSASCFSDTGRSPHPYMHCRNHHTSEMSSVAGSENCPTSTPRKYNTIDKARRFEDILGARYKDLVKTAESKVRRSSV